MVPDSEISDPKLCTYYKATCLKTRRTSALSAILFAVILEVSSPSSAGCALTCSRTIGTSSREDVRCCFLVRHRDCSRVDFMS
jgi:hypothetical protein